ncbi:MAG: tRNA (cytidine(34)-2'-O)-methyltransferase [Candidatus Desulforudis sp.]|nr:tRNA (cytidine(34)-2'-O)-methyltransferase [Desulforudis sp.]
MFHVVLVEPEIPQNTGNVARTCAATGAVLHLVHPLGFSVSDRYLKRAGLDYWHLVEVRHHRSFADLRRSYPESPFFFATTRMGRYHTEVHYPAGSFLVFGKETAGLPLDILEANSETCVRLPKRAEARSLNLSNAVAVLLYEALRQHNFPDLKK